MAKLTSKFYQAPTDQQGRAIQVLVAILGVLKETKINCWCFLVWCTWRWRTANETSRNRRVARRSGIFSSSYKRFVGIWQDRGRHDVVHHNVQLWHWRRFVVSGELHDWSKDCARRTHRVGVAAHEVSTSNRAASDTRSRFHSHLSCHSGWLNSWARLQL